MKGVTAFRDAGYSDAEAHRYATICFFGGMCIPWILDQVIHGIEWMGEAFSRWRRSKVGMRAQHAVVLHLFLLGIMHVKSRPVTSW